MHTRVVMRSYPAGLCFRAVFSVSLIVSWCWIQDERMGGAKGTVMELFLSVSGAVEELGPGSEHGSWSNFLGWIG